MTRWIPLLLCLFLVPTASAQTTMEWMTLSVMTIDWGGVKSRADIRISPLPRIQSAREAARRLELKGRKKSSRSAPGERVNRPEFGSGAQSARPTGRQLYKPIRVRKRVDAATPVIRQAHSTKRPLPRVVIKGRDTRGELRTVELLHVSITSLSTPSPTAAKGDVAMEEITLVFEDIRMR